MCIARYIIGFSRFFFASLCYLIQSCNNMIMLFFYSTIVFNLMQTVIKTVVDSFSFKYWLTSADKIVKFLLKLKVFVQTLPHPFLLLFVALRTFLL